jgi:hypothetical protein
MTETQNVKIINQQKEELIAFKIFEVLKAEINYTEYSELTPRQRQQYLLHLFSVSMQATTRCAEAKIRDLSD